jgi:NDP-sugar pyrophosphorylase family protein
MNIMILVAGRAASGPDGDYPLCLTEFGGIPLIERLVKACDSLSCDRFIFALLEEDIQKFRLDNIVSLLTPKAQVLRVREATAGAACTALLASSWIDKDEEFLILSSSELIDADFGAVAADFKKRKLDAGVITFSSIHPRYSYVQLNKDGLVIEASEKNPISRNAVASFYWFARGRDFVQAAQDMIRKDANVGGLYYICPTLNEFVLRGQKIGTHHIDLKQYHPLKTERHLQNFEAALEEGGAS